MIRVAHISDLHFGAASEAATATLANSLAASAPDVVAVSGDLTQRARPREYRAAREFLDALDRPWIAVPGNHDIPGFDVATRFLDPFGRWRALLAPETEPVLVLPGLALVGVNTARQLAHWRDWSRGAISPTALARAEARLAALPPELPRIVLAHHPLVGPHGRIAAGAATALAAFARHGVLAVLTGHEHAAASVAQAGIVVAQAASGMSWRLRGAPNGYNLVTVADGAVTVEPVTLDLAPAALPAAAAGR